MTLNDKHTFDFTPKGMIVMLLIGGLIVMAYSLIFQNHILFSTVLSIPFAFLLCIIAFRNPMFSYIMYGFTSCYFTAIYRYMGISGLSIILDIFLLICLLSIIINVANNHTFPWPLGINTFTLAYGIWLVICIFQILNPNDSSFDLITLRSIFFTVPITYFLSGVLLNSSRKLRITLLLLGIYIITAALKLYWQKTRGWDSTEIVWLTSGAWHTHLLQSGIRYFSFFSDAGNFGATMGMFTITFGIAAFGTSSKYYRFFFLLTMLLSGIGLMMSGTRGAIIIPFGGLMLYFILSKNIKIMTICFITGSLIFSFFYFSDIGNSNVFIRRMRTAFQPSQDASFNVRYENRKRFAYYLNDKPFGVGLGGHIVDTEGLMKLDEPYIPTDSHYVGVWVETGIVGLIIYLGLLVAIILRGCYIIMFNIHNKELRNLLSALLCGVFGLWLSGYVNRAMGFYPGRFLVAIFLSFVFNGPYIGQLSDNKKKLKQE